MRAGAVHRFVVLSVCVASASSYSWTATSKSHRHAHRRTLGPTHMSTATRHQQQPECMLNPARMSTAAQRQQHLGSYRSVICQAGLQAGLLGSASDMMSHSMHGIPIDPAHVAAMAVLGCLLSGMANAMWMRFLEEHIPGPCARAVSLKTLADYCCCATTFNSCFLVGVPYLTAVFAAVTSPDGLFSVSSVLPSTNSILQNWTPEDFHSLMRLEACTFVPYNLLAFRLVPLSLRPLGAASISAICTIVLSGITLGYGGT